jgi:hypothetical protein
VALEFRVVDLTELRGADSRAEAGADRSSTGEHRFMSSSGEPPVRP